MHGTGIGMNMNNCFLWHPSITLALLPTDTGETMIAVAILTSQTTLGKSDNKGSILTKFEGLSASCGCTLLQICSQVHVQLPPPSPTLLFAELWLLILNTCPWMKDFFWLSQRCTLPQSQVYIIKNWKSSD